MFVPGESFLSAAFQRDPNLLEYGLQRNVLLVSPITLIAMLKGVAMGWRHYQVEVSAQNIRKMGLKLYDSIAIMMDHLKKVGLSLNRTVEAYNTAHASIESRVLPRARGLKTLSGATKPLVSVEPVNVVPVASAEDLPLLVQAPEESVAMLEAEDLTSRQGRLRWRYRGKRRGATHSIDIALGEASLGCDSICHPRESK